MPLINECAPDATLTMPRRPGFCHPVQQEIGQKKMGKVVDRKRLFKTVGADATAEIEQPGIVQKRMQRPFLCLERSRACGHICHGRQISDQRGGSVSAGSGQTAVSARRGCLFERLRSRPVLKTGLRCRVSR